MRPFWTKPEDPKDDTPKYGEEIMCEECLKEKPHYKLSMCEDCYRWLFEE